VSSRTLDAGGRGVLWGTIVRGVLLVLLVAVVAPALVANGDALAVPVVALAALGATAVAVAGLGYWLLTAGAPGRWLARHARLTSDRLLCGAALLAALASVAALVWLRRQAGRPHSALAQLDLRAVATATRLTGERHLMETLNQRGIRAMVLLGGLLVLAAVAVGAFRSAALLATTMGLAGGLVQVLKASPPQPLPALGIAEPHVTSWPSGHAALQGSLALGAVLWWWAAGLPRPSIVAALLVPFAVLVGYSRAFLGIHVLSEVLAGWLVATLAGATVLALDRLIVPHLGLVPATRRWRVLAAGGVALVVTVVSIQVVHRLHDRGPRNIPPGLFRERTAHADATRLAAVDPAAVLGSLPRYSESLLGSHVLPVGLVVVAGADRLRGAIRVAGWTAAAVVTPKDLARFPWSGDASVAPTFYDSRTPDLVVHRAVGGSGGAEREAEVWQLPITTPGGCSVWAVTASRYDGTEWDWRRLQTARHHASDIDAERDALAGALVAEGGFEDAGRFPFARSGPGSGPGGSYATDGKVALLRQTSCSGQ
jgi:undecaprenyl-diphosphatase